RAGSEGRTSALSKASWRWCLRIGLGGDYLRLAEIYRLTKDFRSEVLAYRAYARLITGPLWGVEISDLIQPERPVDEAEVNRIRNCGPSTHRSVPKGRFPPPHRLDE